MLEKGHSGYTATAPRKVNISGMNLLLIVILSALCTLVGGLAAIRFKDSLHLVLGFSAGCILAVSLFCLLPESLEIGIKFYSTQTIVLFVAIGFMIYLVFDRLFPGHQHEDEHECENLSHSGKFGVLALIFHSMLDGIAVGVVLQCNPAIAAIIILAILSHKFADGLSMVSVIFCNKGKNIEAFRYLLVSAFAPIVGVAISFFIVIPANIFCLLLSLFAGFFLYLSASDLLIEAYHCHKSFWTTVATLAGITIIYFAIQIAGEFL